MKRFHPLSSSKLLVNVLATLVVSTLLFSGCDTFKNQSFQSFENPYTEVGELHNQALDQVLSDLKAAQNPIEGKKELFDAAESSLQEFAREKGAGAHEIDQVEWGRKLMEDAPERSKKKTQAPSAAPRAVTVLPDSMLTGLSSEQEQYIGKIGELVEDNPSASHFKDRLSELSRSALDELGEGDAAVVLKASAVAKSSYAYWMENFGEWVAVVSQAPSDSAEPARKSSVPTTNSCWGEEDSPNSGPGEAALESADDITWADLAGALAGPWGAAATSTAQALKESTDYAGGNTENDYGCEG